MRSFIFVLSLVCVSHAGAETRQLPTLSQYLKGSSSYVTGQIRFERPHRVFCHDVLGQSLFDARIRANQPIGILLTESGITLTSKHGLRISVAGIPVDITRLSYDDRTGEVRAKSSVLGTRVASHWIEARAEEAVEREFGPKLREAFTHVKTLRAQNSLADVGHVLNAVVDSFKSRRKGGKAGGGHPLPNFEGQLTLVTPIARNEAFRVGPRDGRGVVGQLEAGDQLSLTVMIHVPSRRKLQIRGVIFTSNLGVHLKNLVLHSFSALEESGFRIDAENGIDGVLSGAELVLSTLAGERYSAGGSTVVENMIEAKISSRVAAFATKHRAGLLRAGVTPELVQALVLSPISKHSP